MKKKKKDKIKKRKKETTFSVIEKARELLIFNGILYIILAIIYIYYIGFYLKGELIAKRALNWLFGWIIVGAVIVSLYDFLFDYLYWKNNQKNKIIDL